MDDQDDLALARAGDARAFERIVATHADSVYRIAASIAGDAEAEDVAQEVFVRLHQGLSGFRGDATLSTWLHRVTVNAALTHRARGKRRPRTAEDLGEVAVDGVAESGAVSSETRDRVRRAIDSLPDDMKAVVVLREIEGLPFEEVARTLGIKRPTAESRMARAREKLRELLGGEA
jgi:RNA polymerase sigma-70 factor (ECF subfamily)